MVSKLEKKMTKQEEIREGIHDIIGDCLIKIGCGDTGCPKAERLEEEAQETCIQSLLEYLHENGVVLKVDRGLPKSYTSETVNLLLDGYGAFESLI